MGWGGLITVDLMKCPKYVHQFVDRHGRARFYFRRPGFKKVALPGLPWSPEFMAAYEAAIATPRPIEVGAVRVKPGSMRALAVSYFGSIAFHSMQPSSQAVRRSVIERFCREVGKAGQAFGDMNAATLQRDHIAKMLAARAVKTPEAANALRKALRALMQYAVEIGLRPDDPTRDVKRIKSKSDGFHSWTDEEIARFEAKHPVGTMARLALALLLYTGQRRSDVIRMGPQHVRDGAIQVQQTKTRAKLVIPIVPELVEIIAATPVSGMIFLLNERARPFKGNHFGRWFRRRCDEAGLPHCTAHGLRKAAARRLAEAGCTEHEIKAITGHASLQEVVRYTRAVDQVRLGRRAMNKLTEKKREQMTGQPAEVSQKK
jgi:integrase